MTATERAAKALASPAEFCALMAQAREFKFPGWWDGSAFRSHPVGIISGTIKMTNFWHVDDLCQIEITDGDGWDRSVCQDSRAHGDPHPRPVSGREIVVWDNGSWASAGTQAALEPKVLEVLSVLALHVQEAKAARDVEAARRHASSIEAQRQAEQTAIAKALAPADATLAARERS